MKKEGVPIYKEVVEQGTFKDESKGESLRLGVRKEEGRGGASSTQGI